MGEHTKRNKKSPKKLKKLGRYLLLSKLGEGRAGKVYKAYDTSLERLVALKLLSPKLSTDKRIVQRFIQEAKSTAKLSHPHIVPLYDFEQSGNIYFLTMGFIDGCSLDYLLKKQHVQFSAACKWMLKILDAMSYAHQQGIVHRDIKPSNILINKAGKPFIADFGLSKILEEAVPDHEELNKILAENNIRSSLSPKLLTKRGEILGTPCYMSPEQAQNQQPNVIDIRSDIYSLGAVFYEVLSGKPPLQGENVFAVLYKVATVEIESPKKINPQIPAPLERICMKALAKNKEERYQNAKEMASAISQYLKFSHPYKLKITTMWRLLRTSPILVTVIALLLGVGLLEILYFHRLRQNAPQQSQSVPEQVSPVNGTNVLRPAPSWEDSVKESFRDAINRLKQGDIGKFLASCSSDYRQEDLPQGETGDYILKVWGEVIQMTVIDFDSAQVSKCNDAQAQVNIFCGFKVDRNVVGKVETHYMACEGAQWKYDGDRMDQLVRNRNLKPCTEQASTAKILESWQKIFTGLAQRQKNVYEQHCCNELQENLKRKEDIWKQLTALTEKHELTKTAIMATTDSAISVLRTQWQNCPRMVKIIFIWEGNTWKLQEIRPFYF